MKFKLYGLPITIILKKKKPDFSQIEIDHEIKEAGITYCRFARYKKTKYYVWFFNHECLISSRGNSITLFVQNSIEWRAIKPIVFHQIVPIALQLRKEFMLHASTILINENSAVAFCGRSGRGKSTIASQFILSQYKLLSDDAIRLFKKNKKWWCHPSPCEVRSDRLDLKRKTLQPHKRKNKTRSRPQASWQKRPVQLKGIIFLEAPSQRMSLQGAKPAKSFQLVAQNIFRVETHSSPLIKEEFKNIISIITNVECYSLYYPRQISKLNEVINLVVKAIGSQQDY